MKRVLKWLALIGWMVIIFVFSSQPADVSSEKSNIVIAFLNSIGLNLDSTFGELSSLVVRKTAHFMEYFILYMLMYNVVSEEFKPRKAFVICITGVFLYACTDEFHQTFVPGRAGRFSDVIIDTLGGLSAAALIGYRYKIRRDKT
jgi:VanZ family protein